MHIWLNIPVLVFVVALRRPLLHWNADHPFKWDLEISAE